MSERAWHCRADRVLLLLMRIKESIRKPFYRIQQRASLVLRTALLLVLATAAPAFAAVSTSVTLVSGDPTDIYPGETTRLQITLSNSNETYVVDTVNYNLAAANNLPGTLPNGLKISGLYTSIPVLIRQQALPLTPAQRP